MSLWYWTCQWKKPNSAALPEIYQCMHYYIFNIKLYKCKLALMVECLWYWSKVLSRRVLIPPYGSTHSKGLALRHRQLRLLILIIDGAFLPALMSLYIHVFVFIRGSDVRPDVGVRSPYCDDRLHWLLYDCHVFCSLTLCCGRHDTCVKRQLRRS